MRANKRTNANHFRRCIMPLQSHWSMHLLTIRSEWPTDLKWRFVMMYVNEAQARVFRCTMQCFIRKTINAERRESARCNSDTEAALNWHAYEKQHWLKRKHAAGEHA